MPNSTQQAINIAGIKDGVVVMKDGSYRLVLQVSATNFALKSEQEQNSIIFQYQSFLNSLHFPIEVVISSRRLDLTPYIAKIDKLAEAQTSEILKMQTVDYSDFLKKLIDIANIMKKTFYVVVSYEPVNLQKIGFFGSLFGHKNSTFEHFKISDADFNAHTEQLKQRASTVAGGLGGMGLHCFQLSTENLIELFYMMYNPDEASKERIKDATMLASAVVMSTTESKDPAATVVEPAQKDSDMIDNTAVVEAQRREESNVKKQENQKAGEKEIKTNPEDADVQNKPASPPAQVVAPQQSTTATPVPGAPTPTAQSTLTTANPVSIIPPVQTPPATPPPAPRV